jgi:hypothetical protein
MNRYTQYSQSEYAKPWELPFNELNAALASKQKKQDEDAALNDKLSELMPKAGYVTEPMLAEYKGKYNPLIDQIREQVSKGEGNQSTIKNLASQMVQDPRYDYLAQDYKLKPKIDEYIAKGTYDQDAQGFYKNGVFTPSTGTNIPLGEVYKTVGAENFQAGFVKDMNANVIPQVLNLKPDETVTPYYNPEKGQQEWYVKTKTGKETVYTEDYVRNKLNEGNPGETLGAQIFKNLGNEPYSLFYKEKYKPDYNTFLNDYLSSNRGRFHHEQTIEEKLRDLPNFGKGKGAGSGGSNNGLGVEGPTTQFTDYNKSIVDDIYFKENGVSPLTLAKVAADHSIQLEKDIDLHKEAFATLSEQVFGRQIPGLILQHNGTIDPKTGEGQLPNFTISNDVINSLTPEEQQKYYNSNIPSQIVEKTATMQQEYGKIKAWENLQSNLEETFFKNLDKNVINEITQLKKDTYQNTLDFLNSSSSGKAVTPEGIKLYENKAEAEAIKKVNIALSKLAPGYKTAFDAAQELLATQKTANSMLSLNAWGAKKDERNIALQVSSNISSQILNGNSDKLVNVNDPTVANRKLKEDEYQHVLDYVGSNAGKDDINLITTGVFYDTGDKQWKGMLNVPREFTTGDKVKHKIGDRVDPLQVQVTLDKSAVGMLQQLGVSNTTFEQRSEELKNNYSLHGDLQSSLTIGDDNMKVKRIIFNGPEGNKGDIKATYKGQSVKFPSDLQLLRFASQMDDIVSKIPATVAQGQNIDDVIGAFFKDENQQPMTSNATTPEGKLADITNYVMDNYKIPQFQKDEILKQLNFKIPTPTVNPAPTTPVDPNDDQNVFSLKNQDEQTAFLKKKYSTSYSDADVYFKPDGSIEVFVPGPTGASQNKTINITDNSSLPNPTGKTLPQKYNNPFDITDKAGGIGTGKQDLTKFKTLDDGIQAAYTKFKNIYNGKSKVYDKTDTLEEFAKKYAEDKTYATKLASILGISKDTEIKDVEIKYLMKAISQLEDSNFSKIIEPLIDKLQ